MDVLALPADSPMQSFQTLNRALTGKTAATSSQPFRASFVSHPPGAAPKRCAAAAILAGKGQFPINANDFAGTIPFDESKTIQRVFRLLGVSSHKIRRDYRRTVGNLISPTCRLNIPMNTVLFAFIGTHRDRSIEVVLLLAGDQQEHVLGACNSPIRRLYVDGDFGCFRFVGGYRESDGQGNQRSTMFSYSGSRCQ